MTKKLWLIVSLLLASVMLFTACGGGEDTPDKGAPAAEPVTITVWNAYQTGSAEETTFAKIVENANAALDGVTIEVLQIPFDQIFNKWETEVAAGEGPDMFVAPNDDLGNLSRAGLVMDLDTLLAGKLDHVSQVAIDGMKVDGVLYGVPESAKAVALYYNKSLVADPPQTTAELLAAVEGGAPMTFFIGAYHMFGWSGSFGGQLMDADGKCIADQGGWEEAFEYLLELKAAGAAMDADYGVAEGPFRSGETAFFVNGPWALADYIADLGDDLGVAPIPAGTGNASPLNGIDGFYINPNTENAEKAVEVALFFVNQESSQIYTDEAGHVPIRDDVEPSGDLNAGFAQASATGFPRPQSVEFGNYWTPFGDAFTKVIEGVSTPAEAVAEACAAMNTANNK
jgi:arabinogalactan oligomer/maltooligosaccharide transport system substrate-binding protein